MRRPQMLSAPANRYAPATAGTKLRPAHAATVRPADPKDDTGQSEVGAWYIRNGQRATGQELMGKAFAKHPGGVVALPSRCRGVSRSASA